MAVNAQIVVESRRYSGWTDPRYPIGYWQAARSLIGDATGGLAGIDLVFQGALTNALNSQMYSVERISLTISTNSDFIAQVRAVNMAGPANQGFLQAYAVALSAISGSTDAALRTEALAFLPWFLGSQRTAGITASLSMVVDNVNLRIYDFEAEGYRWSARSVLVDGGPQRPPTGLYRA